MRCTAAPEPIVTYLASSLRRLRSLINRSSRGLERIRKRTVGWVKFAYSVRGAIKAFMVSMANRSSRVDRCMPTVYDEQY
jgi:hypothetical protein